MMYKIMFRWFAALALTFVFCLSLSGQESTKVYDYSVLSDFVIKDITVSGVKYLNSTSIISVSGFTEGQRISIPGTEITDAANKLWNQGLFSDVRITYQPYNADTIILHISEHS